MNIVPNLFESTLVILCSHCLKINLVCFAMNYLHFWKLTNMLYLSVQTLFHFSYGFYYSDICYQLMSVVSFTFIFISYDV